MNGGPSTIDLWDLKPGHENGGPYKEIETTAPGLKIGEHLPKLAKHGDRLAVLRGMSTKEGDHARGTYLMRTGQLPGAAGIQYPSIGALVSKELGDPKAELPNFVSIAPQRFFSQDAFGPGFLGPLHAPLVVGENQNFNNPQGNGIDQLLKVADLERPEGDRRRDRARPGSTCSATCRRSSPPARPGQIARSHAAAYDRAVRLMQSEGGKVFDLTDGEGRDSRQVRPQPVRPGLPARPPAGREGRAVRRGHARQLGHARQQLRPGEEPVRHARPRVGAR